MNKSNFKKIIMFILLLIFVISSIQITTFAEYITDMNGGANFGVIDGSFREYNHELHYAIYDERTYIVFCCQRGISSPNRTLVRI